MTSGHAIKIAMDPQRPGGATIYFDDKPVRATAFSIEVKSATAPAKFHLSVCIDTIEWLPEEVT